MKTGIHATTRGMGECPMEKYWRFALVLILGAMSVGCAGKSQDIRLLDQGVQELSKGNYQKAELYLDGALSVNPDNPYALLNMGMIYQITGRIEKACQMYEKVIALDIKGEADQASEDLAAGKPLVEVAKENLEIIKGQRPEPVEPIKKPVQEASSAPLSQKKTKSEHEERPSGDKKITALEEKALSPAKSDDKPQKQLVLKGKEDHDSARGRGRASSFKRFYSIQIGALESLENAESMVNNLKNLGHNAFYRYETKKGKGNWYRVYIERFGSRKEAEKEAKVLKNLDLISSYLIRAIEEKTQTAPLDSKDDKKVYYLHVNSFKQKANAEKKVKMLEKHGYKAFFLAEEISGENWFRVYIGEYDNEKGARKIGLELKKRGIISYFKPIAIDKNALFSLETKGPSN